jgi:hypothetical protein
MQFNAAKCKVMHLGRGYARSSYYLDGHQMEKTELEKDIALTVSHSLKGIVS